MAKMDVVDLTKGGSASGKVTDAEKTTRQDRKARLAEVLDRGVVGDRLRVQIDESLHYEWPHKDDVTRMKSLGFRLATQEDIKSDDIGLHTVGDSTIRVGDTVLMICDRETKELIDEVKRERSNAAHAPRGGKQKEEKDFEKQVDITSAPMVGSKVNTARAVDITSALEAVNRQKQS